MLHLASLQMIEVSLSGGPLKTKNLMLPAAFQPWDLGTGPDMVCEHMLVAAPGAVEPTPAREAALERSSTADVTPAPMPPWESAQDVDVVLEAASTAEVDIVETMPAREEQVDQMDDLTSGGLAVVPISFGIAEHSLSIRGACCWDGMGVTPATVEAPRFGSVGHSVPVPSLMAVVQVSLCNTRMFPLCQREWLHVFLRVRCCVLLCVCVCVCPACSRALQRSGQHLTVPGPA